LSYTFLKAFQPFLPSVTQGRAVPSTKKIKYVCTLFVLKVQVTRFIQDNTISLSTVVSTMVVSTCSTCTATMCVYDNRTHGRTYS